MYQIMPLIGYAEFKNAMTSSSTFQRVGIQISGIKLPPGEWESLRRPGLEFSVCTAWRRHAPTTQK